MDGIFAIAHVCPFDEEMLSHEDVTSRLFDEGSYISGSDSGGEEGIYAHCGNTQLWEMRLAWMDFSIEVLF